MNVLAEVILVSMIFPGMDPYLEEPQLWPGVHASLVVYTRNYLQPLLRPRYIAAIEERVFVEGPDREIIPDVWLRRRPLDQARPGVALADGDVPLVVRVPALEIHETYVAILDRQSGLRIVTVIEIVSPTNKYPGPGRRSYLSKQREVCDSDAHLVEIDLLRTGNHVLLVPESTARGQGVYHYLSSVNRAADSRELFELYPRTLRERLPRIRVPLSGEDPDVTLDLQTVLEQAYEDGSYSDRLDYDAPCRPPLSPEDQAWMNQRVLESRRQGQ
jgi:Protein of unknown function (DUF4058)